MSSLITFRLRHPQGTSTISLDPDKSIQTLLDASTKETSIPASDLEREPLPLTLRPSLEKRELTPPEIVQSSQAIRPKFSPGPRRRHR
jgi:hypothetical protein